MNTRFVPFSFEVFGFTIFFQLNLTPFSWEGIEFVNEEF